MILEWPLLFVFLTLTLLFPFSSSPIAIGFLLLVITLCIATGLAILVSSFWVSYVLVLVLVGGLMVVFIYVALLASNELFSPLSSSRLGVLGVLGILGFFFIVSFYASESAVEGGNSSVGLDPYFSSSIKWLEGFYSYELGALTLFLALYLFFTLVIVVSISKNCSMTLRNQN